MKSLDKKLLNILKNYHCRDCPKVGAGRPWRCDSDIEDELEEIKTLFELEREKIVEKAVMIINEKVRWAKGANPDKVYKAIRTLSVIKEEQKE